MDLYARRREWSSAAAHAELAIASEEEGARTPLLRISRAAGDRTGLEREVRLTGTDGSAGLPRLLAAAEGARALGRAEAELELLTRGAAAMGAEGRVPGVHFRSGDCLFESRRIQEADDAFRRETDLNPRHAGTWANRAAIAAARGRPGRGASTPRRRKVRRGTLDRRGRSRFAPCSGQADAAIQRLSLAQGWCSIRGRYRFVSVPGPLTRACEQRDTEYTNPERQIRNLEG